MTVRMHGEGVNGRESERESLQGSDQWSGEKVVCSSAHQAVNKQQVIGYQWVFQAKQFTRHKVHLLRLHIESSCNWAAQWGEVPSPLEYWTFWISFRALMQSPSPVQFCNKLYIWTTDHHHLLCARWRDVQKRSVKPPRESQMGF